MVNRPRSATFLLVFLAVSVSAARAQADGGSVPMANPATVATEVKAVTAGANTACEGADATSDSWITQLAAELQTACPHVVATEAAALESARTQCAQKLSRLPAFLSPARIEDQILWAVSRKARISIRLIARRPISTRSCSAGSIFRCSCSTASP